MAYNENEYKTIFENVKLLYDGAQKDKKSALNYLKIYENIIYNLDELNDNLNGIIESLLIDWANEKRNIFEIEKLTKKYNLYIAFDGDGGIWDLCDNDIEKLKKRRKIKFYVDIDFQNRFVIIQKDIAKLLY